MIEKENQKSGKPKPFYKHPGAIAAFAAVLLIEGALIYYSSKEPTIGGNISAINQPEYKPPLNFKSNMPNTLFKLEASKSNNNLSAKTASINKGKKSFSGNSGPNAISHINPMGNNSINSSGVKASSKYKPGTAGGNLSWPDNPNIKTDMNGEYSSNQSNTESNIVSYHGASYQRAKKAYEKSRAKASKTGTTAKQETTENNKSAVSKKKYGNMPKRKSSAKASARKKKKKEEMNGPGKFSFRKVKLWQGGNPEYPVGPFVANYKITNFLKVPSCGRFEFRHPLTWPPPKINEGNPVNCMVVACWGRGIYTCMAWDWCGTQGTSAFNKQESCIQGPEYYVFVISVPGGERTDVIRLK